MLMDFGFAIEQCERIDEDGHKHVSISIKELNNNERPQLFLQVMNVSMSTDLKLEEKMKILRRAYNFDMTDEQVSDLIELDKLGKELRAEIEKVLKEGNLQSA